MWGETGREMAAVFRRSVSPLYLKGFLTYHNILRHGADGFAFPPKEVVLQIFIALKSPSLTSGFELENLGSSGKHDKNYSSEKDLFACFFHKNNLIQNL
jgi:hypothetical protein